MDIQIVPFDPETASREEWGRFHVYRKAHHMETDPDDPFLQLVVNSAVEVYGVPQLISPLVGGSGPNHAFIHGLGVPVATAGLGYPGSNVHAPNENIVIDYFVRGARHTARVLGYFGAGVTLP